MGVSVALAGEKSIVTVLAEGLKLDTVAPMPPPETMTGVVIPGIGTGV